MSLRDELSRTLPLPERAALDEILKQIDAPDNLFNLAGVLAELARIRALVPPPLPWQGELLSVHVFSHLSPLASAIQRLSVSHEFATLQTPDIRRKEPMHGYIQEYPVYSLLPYCSSASDRAARFDRLKAQVLAAALQLRGNPTCRPVVRGGTAAARWLRDSSVVSEFPDSSMAADDYRAHVHAILPRLDQGSPEQAHVGEVRRLLECAIHGYGRYAHDWIPRQPTQAASLDSSSDNPGADEGASPREQANTGIAQVLDEHRPAPKPDPVAEERQLRSSFRESVEADNDPVLPTPGIVIERASTLSTKALRDALTSGLALNELAGEVEYITEDAEGPEVQEPPQISGATVARQAATMKQRLVQIERSAQMLPGSWSRLSPAEVAYGLRDMRRWLRTAETTANLYTSEDEITRDGNVELTASPHEPDDEIDGADGQTLARATIVEACAALATMLWLSKPLEDALQLRFYATPADAEREAWIGVGYVTGTRTWVLPAIRPKQEPVHRSSDFTLAEPVSRCLFLPDHGAAWAYFQRLTGWASARPGAPAAAFAVGEEAIAAAIDEFFLRCLAATESRVTHARWRDTLFNRVVDQTGDTATAAAMLARAHRLGDTQLHYARFPVKTLVTQYQAACAELIDAVLNELAYSDPRLPSNDPRKLRGARPSPSVVKEAVAIGTRVCPTVPSVTRLIEGLAELHEETAGPATELQPLIDFHNALTTYTCWLLRFGTGYRDARTLIPLISDLDLEGRLLLVSDKDDSTGFNTRILPLADIVAEQLEHYRRHRQTLASRLLLRSPDFALAMIQGDVRGAGIANDKHPASRLLRFIVPRGSNLVAKPVGGKALLAAMSKRFSWFRLPTNCNRHYVRSRLVADGCQPEYVDYLMGHWVRGREPLSPFSTLPPRMYLDDVRPRLDRILAGDGWSPVPGLT
ncbi:MAG: hypothetical protein JST93_13925 [Acidobacteria bacterium]|nr:hypothetical protein [Acidobacteriota bacterium]